MAKLHVKYISDLHLDYKTENDKKKFLKLFNQKDTYIIAGDFYNDYRKTLIMIEQLEKMKIHGYWILGNHEYIHLNEPGNIDPSHKGKNDSHYKIESDKKYTDFLSMVIKKTSKYKYLKFLHTGLIKKINDWTIIGDTGWSSFVDAKGKKIDDYNKYEWNHVNNWKWVEKEHNKWVKFVNNTLKKYSKVIILTHHPMYFPNNNDIMNSRLKNKLPGELLFWFSNHSINVPKDKKVIFIHGHTHTNAFMKNHYTNAIGRKDNEKKLEIKTLIL